MGRRHKKQLTVNFNVYDHRAASLYRQLMKQYKITNHAAMWDLMLDTTVNMHNALVKNSKEEQVTAETTEVTGEHATTESSEGAEATTDSTTVADQEEVRTAGDGTEG